MRAGGRASERCCSLGSGARALRVGAFRPFVDRSVQPLTCAPRRFTPELADILPPAADMAAGEGPPVPPSRALSAERGGMGELLCLTRGSYLEGGGRRGGKQTSLVVSAQQRDLKFFLITSPIKRLSVRSIITPTSRPSCDRELLLIQFLELEEGP